MQAPRVAARLAWASQSQSKARCSAAPQVQTLYQQLLHTCSASLSVFVFLFGCLTDFSLPVGDARELDKWSGMLSPPKGAGVPAAHLHSFSAPNSSRASAKHGNFSELNNSQGTFTLENNIGQFKLKSDPNRLWDSPDNCIGTH